MPEYCDNLGEKEHFSKFPDLKVIVDCTEIFTQKPLKANNAIYSNYRNHTIFKSLVAINPRVYNMPLDNRPQFDSKTICS